MMRSFSRELMDRGGNRTGRAGPKPGGAKIDPIFSGQIVFSRQKKFGRAGPDRAIPSWAIPGRAKFGPVFFGPKF